MTEGATERFPYYRSVAPMLWVLVGIATCELAVVHFVVSLVWNRRAAIVLSLLTAGGIAWMTMAILAMKRLPVLVDAGTLTMRAGRLKGATVAVANVAGLREAWSAEDLKPRSVLKLSLIAYPNVLVDLKEPLPGRRGIATIAHRLDDPAGFAAALERVGRAT